jgi:TolB-like protein
MRKRLFMTGIAACMLVFGTGIYAQQTDSLDNAINGAVGEFSYGLKRGSKVAVLAIRSNSARMSNYLIEELISAIVSQRFFTVVDRAQLDLIQQEMNFQMSGEVSDSSAQAIGKKLGAQAIVTGTFELIGNYYRFRVRVIEVESAAILSTYSANVQNDQVVASLMREGGSGSVSPSAPAPAPAPAASDNENFTSGQRWGTWALNMLIPGLGSYAIMKDTQGGTTQLVVGGLGLILAIAGPITMNEAYYTNTEYGYNGNNYYSYDVTNFDEDTYTVGTVLLIAGSALYTANFIYNIVRSATYTKQQPKVGSLADPNAWSLAILPGKNGVETVQLAYTLRY